SRRRHTRSKRDWSSDVCSSDLLHQLLVDVLLHPMVFCRIKKHVNKQLVEKYSLIFGNKSVKTEVKLMSRIGLKPIELPEGVEVRSEERRVGKEWRVRVCRGEEK